MSNAGPLLDRAAIEEAFRIQRLELASPQDVFGLVDEIFPDERPPERARLIVEEVFEAGIGDS